MDVKYKTPDELTVPCLFTLSCADGTISTPTQLLMSYFSIQHRQNVLPIKNKALFLVFMFSQTICQSTYTANWASSCYISVLILLQFGVYLRLWQLFLYLFYIGVIVMPRTFLTCYLMLFLQTGYWCSYTSTGQLNSCKQ